MTRTLIKAGTIVTMDDEGRVVRGGAIVVAGSTIERLLEADAVPSNGDFPGEVRDAQSLVALPGFIQTHIHLCQTLFRGLADDLDLLDWLRLRIFPLEAAHSPSSMYGSARLGLAELIRSGTTTIMDMGSIHHEEEIVRAVDESGIRAFVGKSMMDLNALLPSFREDTEGALASTLRQAEQWHGSAGGRIRYAAAPRFILSCTDDLLRETMEMTHAFPGMLFHTHASEQWREEEEVRKLRGTTTIPHLDWLGLLQPVTCLAHCVRVTPEDVDRVRRGRSKILHCPTSNLKLGSGVARVPEFLDAGLVVSLGSDGAPCNNTLDMFHEMRIAALVQKPLHGPSAMDARTVLTLATRGGASALEIASETGSIEEGKKADLLLLDMGRLWNPVHATGDQNIYSSIVYTGSPANVQDVVVDGRWLVREGEMLTLNEREISRSARRELSALLERAHL